MGGWVGGRIDECFQKGPTNGARHTHPNRSTHLPTHLPHRMEVLAESGGLEEKEEGIWPSAPAPWEASFVGPILDPLMLDPGK